MSSRKKPNGGSVSRQECQEAMEPLKGTMKDVRDALLGKDLRSGLVVQVNNLDNKVTNIINQWEKEKKENEEKRKNARVWKVAALSFASTLFGIVLEFVFNHFGH